MFTFLAATSEEGGVQINVGVIALVLVAVVVAVVYWRRRSRRNASPHAE